MTTEKRDFNQAAATWDENPGRVKLARDIADSMINNLPITRDMNAMDFGCGTGLLTVRLQSLVRSITGVDSSQGMLDILNRKITKLQMSNVKTMLVDIEKGQPLTGNYQLIVSSMTLHHIAEIKPILAQFYNVITPGGFLSIADLDSDDGQFHEDKTGVFHSGFDRNVMRQYFSEAGFDNITDATAATLTKPSLSQRIQKFTIFLITGRKKAK